MAAPSSPRLDWRPVRGREERLDVTGSNGPLEGKHRCMRRFMRLVRPGRYGKRTKTEMCHEGTMRGWVKPGRQSLARDFPAHET